MSAPEVVVGEPKFLINSELSYQKKRWVEFQQDVRKQYFDMSVCQYVSMSVCQNATFQIRYQNESCSKCHQAKVVKECERVRVRARSCLYQPLGGSYSKSGSHDLFYFQK